DQHVSALKIVQGSCSANNLPCSIGADCQQGVCSSLSKICVGSTCKDQILSGSEGDVDCGGTCGTKCTGGQTCNAGTDCSKGSCLATGKCAP
ncbi:MAG: hypothetical protein HY902_04860, partial [Deltaproteobacteria bacterium]|nr:hypothetical protein [Deltaproteobacteria bacterium]